MSDPLSIAASISGLIALAGQLYIALDGFITSVRDAPSLAQTIQAEIKSFRNSLNALQGLIHDPAFHRSRRAALISADYVVVSFTDAVLVFSQLESNVIPLTKFTEFGVVARTQWTRRKPKLNELVARLQWQKHTLVLQLNILRCASDIEAQRNRQVLDTLICERLGKDRDMERRLELVEQQLQLQSNASLCDRASIITSDTTDSDNLTIRPGNPDASTTVPMPLGAYQHAFEELLNSSWVYRRNQNREEDMSMRSSVLRLSAWSILSDMSLANISIIAVISLPVQIQELANGKWYTNKPDAVHAAVDKQVEESTRPDRPISDPAGDEELDSDDSSESRLDDDRQRTLKILESERRVEVIDMEEVEENQSGDGIGSGGLEIDPDDETFYCRKCEEMLEEGKAFELAGQRWHSDCFRCNECTSFLGLDSNLLLLGDGRLVCNNCTYSCAICNSKIEDLAILTGDQAFCANCFRCRTCREKIDGLRFAKTRQGMYCMTCHEMRMKRRRKQAKEQGRASAKLEENEDQA